jgi:N-6 DNA Methylase
MSVIERDNASVKGVLPKDYARPGLDKQRLGQLINLVSDIALGAPADRAKDTLGRVYEYFLSQFASAEGKKGGQFYTPAHVVRVLVEVLAPYKGRVYDPCCGSYARPLMAAFRASWRGLVQKRPLYTSEIIVISIGTELIVLRSDWVMQATNTTGACEEY